MITVDTSVWVDHLNRPDARLVALIQDDRTVLHPYVLVELSLGNLSNWKKQVARLQEIPSADPLPTDAIIARVEELDLQGSGLGFVDAHLLAWALAAPGRSLWSRDRRLQERAEAAGVAWSPG